MASRSVNKVILLGHLGRDAETNYTASQTAVTKFSIATARRWKDQASGEFKEDTQWTNVVLWRGENVAPYLLKGTKVYVEGRIQTRKYQNKEGADVYATDVVADEVILLGGGSQGGDAAEPPHSRPAQPAQPAQRHDGGPIRTPPAPSGGGFIDDLDSLPF